MYVCIPKLNCAIIFENQIQYQHSGSVGSEEVELQYNEGRGYFILKITTAISGERTASVPATSEAEMSAPTRCVLKSS